jgi:hypothetical protein
MIDQFLAKSSGAIWYGADLGDNLQTLVLSGYSPAKRLMAGRLQSAQLAPFAHALHGAALL